MSRSLRITTSLLPSHLAKMCTTIFHVRDLRSLSPSKVTFVIQFTSVEAFEVTQPQRNFVLPCSPEHLNVQSYIHQPRDFILSTSLETSQAKSFQMSRGFNRFGAFGESINQRRRLIE
ncbi:MAG: hypothetical protein ACTS5F_01200 [Candidatus Hodgkinia cicadicola]